MKTKLPKTQLRRLQRINRKLDPARLEYRVDSGTFRYVFIRGGQRHRKSLGQNLDEAYKAALALREQHLHEIPTTPDIPTITLGQWYERLKPDRKRRLADTTWDIEKFHWVKLTETLKNTPLDRLTQNIIDHELDSIEAPSQRDHTAILLRTILNAAVKEALLAKSPFRYTRPRKSKKKKVPTLTPEQLVRLSQAAPPETRPACLLAAFCGLRRGEIMALKHMDINLAPDVMQVDVHKNKVYVDGPHGKEERIGEPKSGSTRIVPIMPDIPKPALDMMNDLFRGKPPDQFIYERYRGNLHRVIKTTCKKLGLPVVGLHDLRHVCGTHWVINHGMPFASAALGHSSIQMTIDTYTDLTAVLRAKQLGRKQAGTVQSPLVPRTLSVAHDLVEHDDPQVRELALLTMQICG